MKITIAMVCAQTHVRYRVPVCAVVVNERIMSNLPKSPYTHCVRRKANHARITALGGKLSQKAQCTQHIWQLAAVHTYLMIANRPKNAYKNAN